MCINNKTLGVFLWVEKVTAIPNTDTRWWHWVELRVDGRYNDGGKLWVCPAAVVSIFYSLLLAERVTAANKVPPEFI